MKKYFPNIYDLKYVIKDSPGLKDVGLAKLSHEIGCSRIGPQHQAGSDSLLTLCCYFQMREKEDIFSPIQFSNSLNVIFGIGIGFLKNNLNGYQRGEEYTYGEYYGDQRFYDTRQNNWNQNMYHHSYGANGPQGGPLYSYLHQQQTHGHHGYVMYHDQQHNRHYQ